MHSLRTLITFLFLLLLSHNGFSQEVDFDEVVKPLEQPPANLREWLVQLAWMNQPSTDILDYQENIAKQEIKNAKLGWIQAIGTSVGFNQTSRLVEGESEQSGVIFFPRLSFGVNFNLTPLVTTPGKVKIAKENFKIAGKQRDQQKLAIRAEVLERYEMYLLAIETLKVRTQKVEDAKANYELLSQLFKNNEATFKDYNDAYVEFYNATEDRISSEAEVKMKKIRIEELIGISLEVASQYVK